MNNQNQNDWDNIIKMDFVADLRETIIQHFIDNGFSISPECFEQFDAMRFFTLHFDYFNQAITHEAREVLLSKELTQKLKILPTGIHIAFKKLYELVENGQDLSKFQSRSRKKKITLKTNYSKRNYQYQLYGITHLRLPDNSNYVLFAIFKDRTSYFIDITEHKEVDWSARTLINIVEKNWPEIISLYKLDGTMKLASPLTDNAIHCLAKRGINTVIETDGGVYLPPGVGMQADGSSTISSLKATRLYNEARLCEIFLQENYNDIIFLIKNHCNKTHKILPNPLEFRYSYIEILGGFVAVEQNSKICYVPRTNQWYAINDCTPQAST